MKYRYLVLVLLLAGGMLGPPAFGQSADPTAASQAPATQPQDRLRLDIQAIREAADPSAVVAAYARGVALEPANRQLLEAYVHRMVEFSLPEATCHQARMLVDLNPDDGVAWGVLSFVAARQGRMAEALADLVQAAGRQSDSAFVQQTAGELLAWYDLNKPTVSSSLGESLEQVRNSVAGHETFANAYADASGQLKQEARVRRSAQSQPATQGQAEAEYPELPNQPWPQLVYPDINYAMPEDYLGWYPSYPEGIYYPSLVYSAPYCAPDWCWWNTWWPYGPFGPFSSRTFVDRDDFHNHHDLWRLDRDGLSLLFLRHHDRFSWIGFDHSRLTNWLEHSSRSLESRKLRGLSLVRGPRDVSRSLASLSGGNQSRIFAPGRQPASLSFGRSATAGELVLRDRRGPSTISRTASASVQRSVVRQSEVLRPTVVLPRVTAGSRADVSRPLDSGQLATLSRNTVPRLYVPQAGLPSVPTLAPTVINPQVGRADILSPRVYAPSVQQFNRVVPAAGLSPRMDVSRPVVPLYSAPRSLNVPSLGGGGGGAAPSVGRSFGGGLSRSGGDISRGVSGGGHGGGRR